MCGLPGGLDPHTTCFLFRKAMITTISVEHFSHKHHGVIKLMQLVSKLHGSRRSNHQHWAYGLWFLIANGNVGCVNIGLWHCVFKRLDVLRWNVGLFYQGYGYPVTHGPLIPSSVHIHHPFYCPSHMWFHSLHWPYTYEILWATHWEDKNHWNPHFILI